MKPWIPVALALGLVSGLVAAPPAGRMLDLDRAHSRIEVDVKATMGSFVGELAAYDADVELTTDGRVRSARLNFKFSDVQTGDKKRDRHMHDWQQTDRFPDGCFVLAHIADGVAHGNLSLHGRTRELAFPVTILTEGPTMAIDGEAVIDTEAFGLPIIRKFLALKVNPLITVRFHLQGRVSGAH